MKSLLRLPVFLFLCLVLLGACRPGTLDSDQQSVAEEKVSATTTIYLVRHAEKETSSMTDEDPDLTAKGKSRAEALRSLLEGQDINALYATKYMRTINTLKPLADERQLEIMRYEGHDFRGLHQRLLQQHRGQTVVVAGHSNTLLPIIEAFGTKRPMSDISDSEYNYLFKLTVDPDNKTSVEVSQFGE